MTVATQARIIVKRDGRVVEFDPARIEAALGACFRSVGREPRTSVEDLTARVVGLVSSASNGQTPTVEGVQDLAEVVLQAAGEFDAAKHYILYREERAKQRASSPVSEEARGAFAESADYFPTQLQQFQFYDKYSRFDYGLGRRETWLETVDRVCDQLWRLAQPHGGVPLEQRSRLRAGISEMRVAPSMRLVAMAGAAFERDNATQYNCTYLPADGPVAVVEALLLSMAGCGVGFSVERQYVEKWPRVTRQRGTLPAIHVVEDSAQGWGIALEYGLMSWLDGEDVTFDVSQVRPYGSPLRVKGGRSSGPEPLVRMLDFARRRVLARQGSTLRTTDVHDIMCMAGNAAVSGGVRRTAMISLFDRNDLSMLSCKSGDFERENNQRWNANNSVVWDDLEQLTQVDFMRQWLEMVESGRGEPGIFSRAAANQLLPPRRVRGYEWGSNPCGEIILRPWEMCNLTTVPARAGMTIDQLAEAVSMATLIGTIQSLGTHFPYLRPQWRANAEEERLLGVSIGGQMDTDLLTGPSARDVLAGMRGVAFNTNGYWAREFGINRSASITCVKPDGNSSVLFDMSSGIGPRFAPYYVRNVRVSASSPIARVLKDSAVPMSPENGDDPENPRTWVVSFPVRAPEGALTRDDVSALDQCEQWLVNKRHWTEHNPSVTITYRPDEVIGLQSWVWDHREEIGGMAFLPVADAKYDQLPYIAITREQYEEMAAVFPEVDYSKVCRYEKTDYTEAAQTLACVAGLCEV